MPIDRPCCGWRAKYGVLAAALALTAACQCYIAARSPVIAKDGIAFIHIAKELAVDPAAAMRLHDQHPGYPAMVLACECVVHALIGRDEFQSFIAATRLASGLCGLATVVFLWLFARRLYDERIANVTVLLAAVWPLFRLNASDSLSDTPHLMFYLAGVWFACEGFWRRRVVWLASAGLASGLAFWVRPEGLVVAAAVAAALLAEFCWTALKQLRRALGLGAWGLGAMNSLVPSPQPLVPFLAPSPQSLAPSGPGFSIFGLVALLAATAITVAPYVMVAGKFTSKKLPFRQAAPSEHAVAIASTEPTPGILSEPGPGATLPDEFSRPSQLMGVVALGLVELGRELAQGFYYLALIPLAAGTFMPGRPRPAQRLMTLHILLMNGHAALLMLLYLTAGYISHRHVMPLVALMLPTAAAGAVLLADQASRHISFAGSPRRALAMAVGIFYLGLVPKCLTPVQAVYLPVYQAAQWVKSQAQPGDSVLSTSGYVRFYANLPGILVGSEAPNMPIAFHFAPDKSWTFLVLEIDERSFDRQALCGPAGNYDQIFELAAHPRRPWAKVTVFQRRGSAARLARAPGPN